LRLPPLQSRPSVVQSRLNFHTHACAELHQLCERVCGHLRHDASAVDFHSHFTRAQVRSNLLVQTATNHPRHHLSFPWRQRFEAMVYYATNLDLHALLLVTL
jgi:2'-5' RNA ligase